ncbi:MAG TPA: hypothetical protein VFQ25_06070 [Ktedonobacterales bacterium]|nr:hypothetical protein [Ktedonobacterales bacterium]
MRTAAIILSVLALTVTALGMLAYVYGESFLCFSRCPSVSSAGEAVVVWGAIALGPALLLSLVAWILSLLLARARGRSTAFIVTLMTPIAVIAAGALILYLIGGVAPVAAAGDMTFPPADRQVSDGWVGASFVAPGPLIIWPLVSFVVALMSAPKSPASLSPATPV